MSRQPDTPRTDDSPAGQTSTSDDINVGPRYTSNTDILRIEQELRDDGVELANRAIPVEHHPMHEGLDSPEAVRDAVQTEAESEDPNRDRIAHLNRLLLRLQDDGDGDE